MKQTKPIYIKLLIAALALWIIGMSFCVTELYRKIGEVEHALVHVNIGPCRHQK